MKDHNKWTVKTGLGKFEIIKKQKKKDKKKKCKKENYKRLSKNRTQ